MDPSGYQDRSTGLAVFGALQIILGTFCVLMIPCMWSTTGMVLVSVLPLAVWLVYLLFIRHYFIEKEVSCREVP